MQGKAHCCIGTRLIGSLSGYIGLFCDKELAPTDPRYICTPGTCPIGQHCKIQSDVNNAENIACEYLDPCAMLNNPCPADRICKERGWQKMFGIIDLLQNARD